MEEILHHLGCIITPRKYWDNLPYQLVSRIPSINSITKEKYHTELSQPSKPLKGLKAHVPADPQRHPSPSIWRPEDFCEGGSVKRSETKYYPRYSKMVFTRDRIWVDLGVSNHHFWENIGNLQASTIQQTRTFITSRKQPPAVMTFLGGLGALATPSRKGTSSNNWAKFKNPWHSIRLVGYGCFIDILTLPYDNPYMTEWYNPQQGFWSLLKSLSQANFNPFWRWSDVSPCTSNGTLLMWVGMKLRMG